MKNKLFKKLSVMMIILTLVTSLPQDKGMLSLFSGSTAFAASTAKKETSKSSEKKAKKKIKLKKSTVNEL